MGRLLLVASVLVFLISIPLLLGAERTAELFAWTIKVPLTAAFLGGAYIAAGLAELLSSRERLWANARTTVPPVLLFTTVTLVVTLVNREVFHFGSDQPIAARAVAWIWLVVYAAVPIILVWQWALQVRVPGADPTRTAPLTWWARGSLLIHLALMLPLGFAFLLAPEASRGIWPWQLTPLTAQAIGAWALGLGTGAAIGVVENDWRRLRSASPAYVAFGALGLLAMVRYRGTVDWGAPSSWVLAGVLLSLLAGGLVAWRTGQRAARAEAA